ncbi:MAG: hypothetical protein P1U36_01695 [Legionellaceae bacterium]|nr:hypothetical protein [Legionellaceae bacterium]
MEAHGSNHSSVSTCSMFHSRRIGHKTIYIDVEWKGPVKTLTREYTRFSLRHNTNSENACTDTPERVDLEVCLYYRKCSTQEFRFAYDASHTRFVQSPVYFGEGEDKFGICLSMNEDEEQRFKLTIKNQTDVYGTRVMLSANVSPVAVDKDHKPRLNL